MPKLTLLPGDLNLIDQQRSLANNFILKYWIMCSQGLTPVSVILFIFILGRKEEPSPASEEDRAGKQQKETLPPKW
jgi:hypothetical protein